MTANAAASSDALVVGVDVGTGSARAAVFDLAGRMLGFDSHPIQIFHPRPEHVEQSSEDIWAAVSRAVRGALERAAAQPDRVRGISFDATCSLVALDRHDGPVTLSTTGDPSHNVIVWMDHRAEQEAAEINRTGHAVLDYVGGTISPEQEPPKLKWVKRHLPQSWRDTARFLDLADFLVYRASGEDVRSLCTVVCKWTYLGHEGPEGSWDGGFFEQVGLEDLLTSGRAGEAVRPMGTPAGTLSERPAADLGLRPGTVVGVGMIDAHSGGVGCIGLTAADESPAADGIEHTLCLIGGTSSCHMAVSRDARFVPGVWGPYFGAMIPGMWLTEGGQSATGALIDHVIEHHAHTPTLRRDAEREGLTVYELLNRKVAELKGATRDGQLTRELHVMPDFLGNRSPRADSTVRGMISGLSLDSSLESLARLYLATIQAIAYGTRHIIEALEGQGYRIDRVHATGGGTRNPLWLQEHADITGRPIYVAPEVDAVLLGAGMEAWDDSTWKDHVRAALEGAQVTGETIDAVLSATSYQQADVTDGEDLRRLIDTATPAPALYFALPPAVTARACEALSEVDLPRGTVLVLEKPFGIDEDSAK
ncbi:MAG: FGGY-family carbohydrate kinase, partial [Gemmatimonadetes bacterium]|nr:FGGY-family carbohydrate kinase [Gemmatimonadota bacterium]